MSETDTTALEVIPKESALAVLTNPEKFDEFYERVAKEVRGVEPDLTTAAGRKAVAALAFKVTKSKTAIVAAADLLTEDARAQIAKVNASKKEIEERLDALKKEVRKPLTDWEAAEELRIEQVETHIAQLRAAAVVAAGEAAVDIESRLTVLQSTELDPDKFRDHLPIAQSLLQTAVAALIEGKARAVQAESDAAELATLRAQTAERDRQDTERREREDRERIEREAEERRQEEARQEEARREQEEAERIERERVEQEEQAERDRIAAEEAEEAARVAEEQRIENERIAEEQRVAREAQIAEQAAAAERQRIADEQAAADAAAVKREANRKHAAKIMGEAKVALIEVIRRDDIDGPELDAMARAVVQAIVAGQIPHTTITF